MFQPLEQRMLLSGVGHEPIMGPMPPIDWVPQAPLAVVAHLDMAPQQPASEIAFGESDPVLWWNQVLLDTLLADSRVDAPDQNGPTLAARAMAIVHVAIFDAYNAVDRQMKPLYSKVRAPNASAHAAIAHAAHDTLVALFPQHQEAIDAAMAQSMDDLDDDFAKRRGTAVGKQVARVVLKKRAKDGWDNAVEYVPAAEPGHHQPDPMNPDQGFVTPHWGKVHPFVMDKGSQMRLPAFPSMSSDEYTAAFEQVRVLGALDAEVSDRDGDGQPDRTDEQTEIGIFWGYDHRLGKPVRLYNQAVRVIAEQMGNTTAENARLFALVNMAMADAGIVSWDMKYEYNIWRPIVAIRNADTDGNPNTIAEPDWMPLGAPGNHGDPPGFPGFPGPDADPDPVGGTMGDGDFTPPFPAYTSGHATFGAAAFRMMANFYGTDNIPFELYSEDSGTTRQFDRLSQASEENGFSRIYLGIHWAHDDVMGRATGNAVADIVFEKKLVKQG